MPYRFIIIICLLILIPISAQAQRVPEMDFSEFEKNLISNSDTVYVINFWATWCAPCRKELPEFEKVHKLHAGDKVKVLLVSLDFPEDAKRMLTGFLTTNHISAPVILLNEPDANSWIDKVHPSWTGALPATLIFKKNQKIFFEKQLTYDDISNSISTLNQL